MKSANSSPVVESDVNAALLLLLLLVHPRVLEAADVDDAEDSVEWPPPLQLASENAPNGGTFAGGL